MTSPVYANSLGRPFRLGVSSVLCFGTVLRLRPAPMTYTTLGLSGCTGAANSAFDCSGMSVAVLQMATPFVAKQRSLVGLRSCAASGFDPSLCPSRRFLE